MFKIAIRDNIKSTVLAPHESVHRFEHTKIALIQKLFRLMNRHVRTHREAILRLAREHGARNVRVFGSAARGDETATSDLDVLVDMEEGRSLIDHVALKQDLEELLGQEVDVVTEASLHPQMRERVLREAVPL